MFEWLGRCHGSSAAALSSGRGCTQRCFTGSGVSASGAGIFDRVTVGSLQLSRASCRIQASVSAGVAIELETLARRAFIDIDPLIQLQMVRDRFIDGQAECALRRHLDSLGSETPMADIVDCCRVWESHLEVKIEQQTRTDRRPARAICQVTVDEQTPAESPETELLEDIIRKLLPTPALPPPEAAPIRSDRDLLIQRLMGAICPPQPVAQERSRVTELETMLLNWPPVGTVMEDDAASPNSSSDSAEGCFSCGVLTQTTDQCQTLDELFPFLPTGWQADRIGDQFILGPGPKRGP